VEHRFQPPVAAAVRGLLHARGEARPLRVGQPRFAGYARLRAPARIAGQRQRRPRSEPGIVDRHGGERVERRIEPGQILGEPVGVVEPQIDPATRESHPVAREAVGEVGVRTEVADGAGIDTGVPLGGQPREQVVRPDDRIVERVDAEVAGRVGDPPLVHRHSATTSVR
jgi:hypothetical protein